MRTIKYNIHYIVTKDSNDGEIKVGETLLIKHDKKEPENGYFGYEHFTIFTPVKENAPSFFGMPALCDTRNFDTEQKMLKALEGVEVKLNKNLAEI